MGYRGKFDPIYALFLVVYIILSRMSKFDLKFSSITHIFEKNYPDYLHALSKPSVVKNTYLFKTFAQIAQILRNSAHLSGFKKIVPFAF